MTSDDLRRLADGIRTLRDQASGFGPSLRVIESMLDDALRETLFLAQVRDGQAKYPTNPTT